MLRLTDAEKQDIIRHLDADRPLPDKYRFLLFGDKREVELVWNGKTNQVCNVVLPFQTIEQVDEPREERSAGEAADTLFDPRGRQLQGWTNKLIWGDNKLILSSLKSGPMREEIERQGGIKLIYIDPPFDVGADFSMEIEIGDEKLTKEPGILEEIAYRDTWGRGADSYIAMLYERLILMRDLLAADGSIYVHCDWRTTALVRSALDEVFGPDRLRNQVEWCYTSPGRNVSRYKPCHDTIWYYSKGPEPIWTNPQQPLADATLKVQSLQFKGQDKAWQRSRFTKDMVDWWEITFHTGSGERVGYPTQKPESLIARILDASTRPGDLVADFFAGSGTVAAVSEKLGRKWIASDLGKFAVHTTRKRMIGVQRELKAEGKDYRAFEILNLGRYERQHFVGVTPSLREEEQRAQQEAKEAEFLALILRAYQAEAVTGFEAFHGKKAGRLVAVGPVNMPVTRLFVEELILECRRKRVTKVDVLGFEFEMGLFPHVLDEARDKGIDIAPKYIPAEVFDKRAVEKNQVVFHDVAFIEVTPHIQKGKVAIELTDFSVHYSQSFTKEAEEALSKKGSRVVVEKGQIVKVSRDAKGIIKREILTKKWTDWIDYWAIDFDYESKREIVRVPIEWNADGQQHLPSVQPDEPNLTGWKEVWTGDYVFENEWQSFRTRRDRSLELRSVFHECKTGRRKIAVKVVDIFGNDTMTIVDVDVP